MAEIRVRFPELHVAQESIRTAAAGYPRKVLACGRRFGKSLFGEELVAEPALEGKPTAWFAPTYKYLLDIWNDLASILAPVIRSQNKNDGRITLVTGGWIDFWTLDSPDPGRSRHYARAVVDEAGMCARLADQWEQAIEPALMDHKGDAWFLGTPKGHNFFWRSFQRGQDAANSEWASWQMPSSANPYLDPEYIERKKRSLPERVFAQEYQAAFLDDAGGVFRNVADLATASEQADPKPGHRYVFGIDWGRREDFTVIAVVDENEGACVHVDRFTRIDFAYQLERVRALAQRFTPYAIVSEDAPISYQANEDLQRSGLKVEPWPMTQGSKEEAIFGLSASFDRREIQIIPDPVLVSELQAYEPTRLPSGRFRYSAPEGLHDDTVIALALAWTKAAPNRGGSWDIDDIRVADACTAHRVRF